MEGGERIEVRDLVAAVDQAGAALADVARMLAGYRDELVAAGFETDEALEFCLELQRSLIFGGDACTG